MPEKLLFNIKPVFTEDLGKWPPPELNDENSKKLVRKFIKEKSKRLKNTIEKIMFFCFFIILLNCSITNTKDITYITNQESNMLDVIDLKAMKKIDELKVGMKPQVF